MEYLSKVAKQHILRWIKNRKYFDEYPFSANFAKETHYFDMKTYWVDILTFFCVVILCFFTADVLAKGAISQKYSVTYFSSQNGVEDGLVNDIIQDHKGLLWFATWNGLYRFDGYNFKNYKSNMEDLGGLTNDRLLDIVEDKFGCIWVLCYDSTCYRFNPDKEVFEPVIQKTVNNFRSISVLPNGIVWLLCEDGSAVRVVTAPEDLSMTFQFYSSRENTLATGKIRSVFMDSKLQEWLLTDEGVYRLYDSELSIISLSDCRKSEKIPFYFATELEEYIYLGAHQGKVYKYLLTGELSIHTQLPTSASVISILPSVAGLIYVTDSDGFFIHDSLGEIRHVMLDSLSLLKDKNIESAKITCGDLLWLVHPVPGVTLFDLKTQRLSFIEGKDEQRRPLNTESDFFAFEDRNDILWVHPKGGGFSYFDSQNRRLIPFNTTEQPVKWKSNDRCFAAFVDKQGNLWLVTGGGLVKFVASAEQIQYSSEHIAFNMHFSEGVGATDGKQIFFGTNRGLFYFTPENIHKTDFIPQIFFSSIWVNNQELTPRKTPSILSVNPDNSKDMQLPPNNHTLRLVFSALDMTNTEYIQYAYKLDGFDKNFRLTDNGHEANYTNLPPGKYVFRVKSTNNEGVWVENERTLSFEVLPTFSETPCATMLYFFLIVLFIAVAIYVYTVFYRIKNKAKNEELITQLKLSFFTDVSHELRTPLTLITGPLEYILRDESLSGKVRDTLKIIKKNSDRMQRLVGQILDFSKIQNSKMKLRVQYVDIISFTKEIINYFTTLSQERHISLNFNTQLSKVNLWGDKDKLEKVIFNLLSNAFKYTSDGKNIWVSMKDDGNAVLLQIQDEGVGIKREKQKVIFNRYENVVPDSIYAPLSSGIGLSVAKELVKMHYGSINVESEFGKGSLFTVRLLKGKKHYPSDTEYILSDWNEDTNLDFNSQNELQELNESEKPLMLIVEDNYELRVFIKQIFQEAYRFVEANNGEVGLKKAFSDLPDMIITDIMMPVKSGLQMLQELRNDERTSHIPAIVLTAKTDMDSILTGIHTGADDYITKPFSVNYLQAKVENILARRKMLQAYYCKVGYEEGNENKEKDRSVQLSARDAAFLNKLAKIMEEQLGNPELNVDQLVSYFSLSRTNFFHKLKSLTGMAPIMYIKEIRMRKAAELIKENQYTMAEIAYMVGFSDPHYFSKSFKSYWGMTSTEYAKNQIGR